MKRSLICIILTVMLLASLFSFAHAQELKTLTVLGPLSSTGLTWEEFETTATWQYLVDWLAKGGIKLDVQAVQSDQYATVLRGRILSNEMPDFFYCNLGSADCINLIETGKIIALDDILEYSDGSAVQALSEGGLYYICRQKDTYTDGKLYYLGNVSQLYSVDRENFGLNAITSNQYSLKIRQDWLDRLGLPMPQTLDEFFDALVAFRENDMNGNGVKDERMALTLDTCDSTWGGIFDTGVANWFGLANYVFQLNKVTWKAEVPFLQEGFVPYVQFLKKCVDAGVLYLEDSIGKNDNALSGLMAQDVVSAYLYQATADKYTDDVQKYVTMPLIQAVEGIEPVVTGSVGYKAWNYFAFSADCDKQAAAVLLDVLTSTDYSIWYNFGPFEGETYSITDGVYKRICSTKKDEYMVTGKCRGYEGVYGGCLPQPALTAAVSKYKGQEMVWKSYQDYLNSEYYLVTLEPKMLEHRVASIRQWIANAESVSVMYNMNGDTTMIMPIATAEEADTLSFYRNELYTLMDEIFANLVAGNYPIENVNDYIEQLNAVGLQEVLQVYQGQYDRVLH